MVTTRPIPRKLSELGRLRIGDREPNKSGKGTHPHKLAAFRLTSPNGSLLNLAAEAYGGEVRPWTSEAAPKDEYGRPTQFELYTTATDIGVLIPTFSAVTVAFEQWSASGCQVRCTGALISHCPLHEERIGTPCSCPEDDLVRADLAKDGKACARILRLNVLLPDLPGAGVWRLETKGHYATAELLGTLDLLQQAGQEHQIIEAVLRLEQRKVKRPGTGEDKGTLTFAVPTLWPRFTPRQILSGASGVMLARHQASLPLPLSEHIAALTAPVDPTAPPPRPTGASEPAGEAGAEYLAQIEAVILAHGGQVEPWMRWAERRLQKDRVAWSAADYQVLLTEARALAAHRQATQPQEGPQEPRGGTTPPQDVVPDPSPARGPLRAQETATRYSVDAETGTLLAEDGTPLPNLMEEEEGPGLFGGGN